MHVGQKILIDYGSVILTVLGFEDEQEFEEWRVKYEKLDELKGYDDFKGVC